MTVASEWAEVLANLDADRPLEVTAHGRSEQVTFAAGWNVDGELLHGVEYTHDPSEDQDYYPSIRIGALLDQARRPRRTFIIDLSDIRGLAQAPPADREDILRLERELEWAKTVGDNEHHKARWIDDGMSPPRRRWPDT